MGWTYWYLKGKNGYVSRRGKDAFSSDPSDRVQYRSLETVERAQAYFKKKGIVLKIHSVKTSEPEYPEYGDKAYDDQADDEAQFFSWQYDPAL